IKPAKEHFDRPRPPKADPSIKAVMEENDGSYPSGHATRGQLFAEVLAAALPARRDALLARGRQIGDDRMIAGVHYPSDIIAGRVLGHVMAKALLETPAFRERLAAIGAELPHGAAAVAAP